MKQVAREVKPWLVFFVRLLLLFALEHVIRLIPAQAGAAWLSSCTCLSDFVNTDPDNPAVCECGPGFGFDPSRGVCAPCPKGAYKAAAGNSLCSNCPAGQSTLELASKQPQDCFCLPGFSLTEDSCDDCSPGYFCNGTGIAFSCPEGATSVQGSRSLEECVCKAGLHKIGSSCALCPPGRYKPYDGNDATCPLQCPTSSSSSNGSTSLEDCFCLPGYYAQLEAGFLSRCVSCASLSALYCLGGFKETGHHQLPVALPGYYQTKVDTAFSCHVLLEDGKSTCMGGSFCGEKGDLANGTCVGKYGNACHEGSVGFLCAECPPGWARTGFQMPCQPCQKSMLMLFGAAFADVTSKAAISFVVASMAATSAVRGSSKLHTIMIRITTHWLAACAVITTFDLGQIPAVFWDEQNQNHENRVMLAWPPEITVAMRSFFNALSLTPALVSIDFSAQCHAQDTFPDSPAAPRLALGLYYACLPPLVAAAVVLVSWLAVMLVVPLAARLGHSCNEAGKQRKALEKLQQKLREATEEILHQAGLSLSWNEIEESKALAKLTLAELRDFLSRPDSFVREAIVRSPALMRKACTARATSLNLPMDQRFLAQMDLKPFLRGQMAAEAASPCPIHLPSVQVDFSIPM